MMRWPTPTYFQKRYCCSVQKLPFINKILNPRQLAEKGEEREEGRKKKQIPELRFSFGLSTPTGDLLPLRIFSFFRGKIKENGWRCEITQKAKRQNGGGGGGNNDKRIKEPTSCGRFFLPCYPSMTGKWKARIYAFGQRQDGESQSGCVIILVLLPGATAKGPICKIFKEPPRYFHIRALPGGHP